MPSALDPAPKVYGGDLRELLHNPFALVGALAGCGVTVGLMVLLAVTEARPAETGKESEFEIKFEPGTLVKLGVEIDLQELPERVVLPDTPPEAHETAEQVTDDENARAADEQPEPVKEPEDAPKKPALDRDEKLPPSKLPTHRTNPYDDPPTTTVHKGDPFGDADGWSDLHKEGDAWATAVMKALNRMPVAAFGAKMGEGTSKFQITLCKDGRVKTVQKKGGSLGASDQARVADAVRSLALPKPPTSVASKMKGSCAKIRYTFVWSNAGVN